MYAELRSAREEALSLSAIAIRTMGTGLHAEPNASDTGNTGDAGAAPYACADIPTQPYPESPEAV